MNKTEKKRAREKQIVSEMITLYCGKNHGTKHGGLCTECKELRDYAVMRSDKCPFMDNKTFCSNCKVHCYKPEMRERIRKVMRYSGPRMMFHHPAMAIRHVIESKREKRRLEKENGD
ncbi:MAG: nitrous oxide-stimulated promoter family protein [Acetatifactor sp.]|nr:nitrous oxide-stimulated promoter family protein [Acetatifactor sp.]